MKRDSDPPEKEEEYKFKGKWRVSWVGAPGTSSAEPSSAYLYGLSLLFQQEYPATTARYIAEYERVAADEARARELVERLSCINRLRPLDSWHELYSTHHTGEATQVSRDRAGQPGPLHKAVRGADDMCPDVRIRDMPMLDGSIQDADEP